MHNPKTVYVIYCLCKQNNSKIKFIIIASGNMPQYNKICLKFIEYFRYEDLLSNNDLKYMTESYIIWSL